MNGLQRPRREVTPAEYGVLAAWLCEIEKAPPLERPMLAIRAREDFKGWPCIVCTTCDSASRYRMTISGVIDHYRRASGYIHEFVIDDAAVRVVA